jgi:hypothetical protein
MGCFQDVSPPKQLDQTTGGIEIAVRDWRCRAGTLDWNCRATAAQDA